MKERIIVLRTIRWSEADLMVQGLNPAGGRMSFIARSALKSRKRFGGGVLEPTHYILAHYRSGAARDEEAPLYNLNEAELIKGFQGLRDSYERLEAALAMVGLMAKVAQPGIEDAPELFDLMGNALYAAESSAEPALLQLQFETKLLYLLGVLSGLPGGAELLAKPLKEHHQVRLGAEQRGRIQHEVRLKLQRYLTGLAPLSSEGVEI